MRIDKHREYKLSSRRIDRSANNFAAGSSMPIRELRTLDKELDLWEATDEYLQFDRFLKC